MKIAMSECCSTKSSQRTITSKPARKTDVTCPRCGHAGHPVTLPTLKHQVKPEYLEMVEVGSFNFCRTAKCDVVYFNERGATLTKADVRQRIGFKETVDPVPLCYCFGFTKAMVVDEIRVTGRPTIPQQIAAEVEAGTCACEIRNPQGSCCLGTVAATVKEVVKAIAAQPAPLPH
jgi:hypothetical protein